MWPRDTQKYRNANAKEKRQQGKQRDSQVDREETDSEPAEVHFNRDIYKQPRAVSR